MAMQKDLSDLSHLLSVISLCAIFPQLAASFGIRLIDDVRESSYILRRMERFCIIFVEFLLHFQHFSLLSLDVLLISLLLLYVPRVAFPRRCRELTDEALGVDAANEDLLACEFWLAFFFCRRLGGLFLGLDVFGFAE